MPLEVHPRSRVRAVPRQPDRVRGEELEADLDKIRSWFGRVRARDWFDAPNRTKVEVAIAECATRLEDFTTRVFEREAAEGPSLDTPLDIPWGETDGDVVPMPASDRDAAGRERRTRGRMTGLTPHELALVGATFLASAVEIVEAYTIVLAMGLTRGWRSTIIGALAALAVLAAVTVIGGYTILRLIPKSLLQLVIGGLLLTFGLQWLRKAVLRSAGLKAMHDEAAIFDRGGRRVPGGGKPAGVRPGLVRLRRVVQGRAPRRARGRGHRPDVRHQRRQHPARAAGALLAILPSPPSSSSSAARSPASPRTPSR